MKYYTHLAFSFMLGILLMGNAPGKSSILFIGLVLIFSILPDIDEPTSKISKKTRPLSWLINLFLRHRGIMHSIWIPIILYLAVSYIRKDIAIAIALGYFSHIILDCLTVTGIRVLWPLDKRIRGFIKTGSWIEYLVFVGLLIVDVCLLVTF